MTFSKIITTFVLGIIFLSLIAYAGWRLGFISGIYNLAVPGVTSYFITPTPLDTLGYDWRLIMLANNPVAVAHAVATTSTKAAATSTKPIATTTLPISTIPSAPIWPPKTVYPKVGAILPFHRIVAYYGNFYSKQMGVLGQYPDDEMLQKLAGEVARWSAADPLTPVIPAVDYIVTTAQGSAGADGTYMLRMPDSQIDHAIELAQKAGNGIVFLDVQVGLSNLQTELPMLEKYLKLPQVHLAIDPEFSMKTKARPGTVIGTMDATDVNYAADFLAALVKQFDLPPKILVVHRFTRPMVTNYKQIAPQPEVQIVMDMDGWGAPDKKQGTYYNVIYREPVQFSGFKLFYKNDFLPPSPGMLSPEEILKLTPRPIYIQYQ